ncbi:MAG: signal recognition particle protein [Alphaproteobacteria bacterium]|nr:MAG: signal recognition particle protein [Alphaproteobacteria bacterium]
MFGSLTERLGSAFEGLFGKGVLTEEAVGQALREVRIALLEADVALPVAKDFIDHVRAEAVGEKVLKSVKPGEQVVKIVHDALVEMLGAANESLDIAHTPPVPVLMVGLQGSGKTTTTAKLAKFLTEKEKKKVLMASLDTQRPAAQEQLEILGQQIGVDTLEIIKGQKPVEITDRALKEAKLGGYDVVILDTAGRLSIDEELMTEVAAVRDLAKPRETLLVADALTGQDAVNTAKNFHERLGLSGIVLTRIDGDSRGGAALSMKAVTGCPIKFIGTGEKTDALQPFHPERIADRILDMGDVVSLVEKAAETIEKEEAEKMAKKFQEGKFDLDDFSSQLKQMRKMGGFSGIMSLMPGMGKLKSAIEDANLDNTVIKQQEAILSSMTKKERGDPRILNASRRRRIADGSGTSVQDVNRLLKQFQQMQTMMKKMRKMGGKGLLKSLGGMLGGSGKELEAMAAQMGMGGDMPPELSGKDTGPLGPNPFDDGADAGGFGGGMPPGLGGLGGGMGIPPGMPPLGGGGSRGTKKPMNKRKKAQAAKRAKKK